jgi:hypothetical protein
MSWVITPSNLLVDDQDALTYLAAVEAADGQALESATRLAVNAFVKGCKADGIWPAIKASCILAGARTLTGALVPLAGPAPTNFNFVAGDYNRKTGLVGDGSTKYLSANRLANADPTNNCHMAAYVSTVGTQGIMGSEANPAQHTLSSAASRNRTTTASLFTASAGLVGNTRSASAGYALRNAGSTSSITQASLTADGNLLVVFNTLNFHGNHRLAFYSIGESLDLALLDARVTDLINAFAAAIP